MRYNLLPTLFLLSFLPTSFSVCAVEFGGELGLEARYFLEDGLQNQDKFQPSVRGEIDFQKKLEVDSFNVELFARVDRSDSERSHVDVREAYWTHVADDWEMKLGISKVFWGVTESRHLVDVINQTDLVENIDGEDKLGQVMAKFAIERDWGNLDVFLLPYFRERTFAGRDGRLNPLPFVVDMDNAMYESSAEEWHTDVAIRYAVTIDDLDLAISHFSGTSRNPVLTFNGSITKPAFTPVYTQIDQTGLELQYIYEDWLWKFEGVASSGEVQRYSAAVFGFEYTQVGILETSADLGWIVEYLFDDRRNHDINSNKAALHSFERDVFLGWRYAMNDASSTEVLVGAIIDTKTEEALYSIEFSRRLASDLKINLEIRAFDGAEGDASSSASKLKTYQFRDEDYLQLELVKFF